MKDDLGKRIKSQYEDRTRYYLPRRTYTIIRLDGKAFHTYTKNCQKPYDETLAEDIDYSALRLCWQAQGCKFAYTQSDEISLLLTDFETNTTEAWFDGNIQKIVSVSASIVTEEFCKLRKNPMPAYFDARVFTIPDWVEVANYFIWRQKDAVRNSIQMLAQSLYSHKELHKKSTSQLQEMCFQAGHNWNDISIRNKRGGFIRRKFDYDAHSYKVPDSWQLIECPHFTVDVLSSLIPKLRQGDSGVNE